MIDPYLLSAPILLLGIVALLRFVGCGFAPRPGTAAPNLVSATAGNGQVTLTWTESDTNTTDYSYQVNRRNDMAPLRWWPQLWVLLTLTPP